MLTGKEMADKLLKMENGEKAAMDISDFVNSFTFDGKGFITEIEKREDTKYLNIAYLWLFMLHIQNVLNMYDERNEYSVKIGDKLFSILHDEISDMIKNGFTENSLKAEYDKEDSSQELLFVKKMSREHRTLQQSFSGLVFEGLTKYPNKKLEVMDSQFYRVPII